MLQLPVACPISSWGVQRQPHLARETALAVEQRVAPGWKLELIGVGTKWRASGFPRIFQTVVEIQPFSFCRVEIQEVAVWPLEPALHEQQ